MKNTYTKFILAMAFSFFALCITAQETQPKQLSHVNKGLYGGCPIANFAFTVQTSPDGNLFGHIWQNTGKLGGWLNDKGSLSVEIQKGGKTYSLNSFAKKNISRRFPFVKNTYFDKKIIKIDHQRILR